MHITYTLQSQEADRALVMILPDKPINGFHGCDLILSVPDHDTDTFIRERVTWKVRQEIGDTEVDIVKG